MILRGKILWPQLFTAVIDSKFGGEPKYSCSLLLHKDSASLGVLRAAVRDMVEGVSDAANAHLPVNDCNAREDCTDDFRDHFILKMKTRNRPGVVDSQLEHVLDPGQIRGGDNVNVSCGLFAYDGGIACGLNNVQLLSAGEKILGGGSTRPEQDFAKVIDENPPAASEGGPF